MWGAIRRSRIAPLALASGAMPPDQVRGYCTRTVLHAGMRGAVCDLQRGIARAFLDTYPRRLWGVRKSACRGLRRDVDGPIHRLMWPRSAPGRRANGSRSRRLAATVVGDRPAMAWSRRPPHRGTWPEQAADFQRRPKSPTRLPKGNPRGREALGSQRWLPEETPTRVSWGSPHKEPPVAE